MRAGGVEVERRLTGLFTNLLKLYTIASTHVSRFNSASILPLSTLFPVPPLSLSPARKKKKKKERKIVPLVVIQLHQRIRIDKALY